MSWQSEKKQGKNVAVVKRLKKGQRVTPNGIPIHDRATGRHLPYGITQCYLLPDTSERQEVATANLVDKICSRPNPSLPLHNDLCNPPAVRLTSGRSVWSGISYIVNDVNTVKNGLLPI